MKSLRDTPANVPPAPDLYPALYASSRIHQPRPPLGRGWSCLDPGPHVMSSLVMRAVKLRKFPPKFASERPVFGKLI